MSDYASKVLGAALLQGWTMSVQECEQPTCPGCPMMVSRDGKESFCARCDGGAKVGLPRPGPIEPLATSLSASAKNQTRASSPTSSVNDGLDALIDDRTAPNTPPTPPSHLASPPLPATAFDDMPVPAVDSAQAAARREQSDQASALIGQRLLQGWALLDAQCENDTCFAVPLMRRPAHKPKVSDVEASQAGGSSSAPTIKIVDPRRYCVICHRDYLKEGEIEEYERFVAATQGKAATAVPAPQPAMSAREKEINERIEHSSAAKKRRFAVPKAEAAPVSLKGKERAVDSTEVVPASHSIQKTSVARSTSNRPQSARHSDVRDPSGAYAEPVVSLERAVARLSQRLDSLTEDKLAAMSPNWATDIAETAEALAKTCKALEAVRQLS